MPATLEGLNFSEEYKDLVLRRAQINKLFVGPDWTAAELADMWEKLAADFAEMGYELTAANCHRRALSIRGYRPAHAHAEAQA